MRKFLVWKSRFLLDSSFLDLFLRVFLIFFLLGVDIDVFCYLFICIYYVFMYQSVYSICILIYFDIFFKNPHVYHMGTFRTQVILCSFSSVLSYSSDILTLCLLKNYWFHQKGHGQHTGLWLLEFRRDCRYFYFSLGY